MTVDTKEQLEETISLRERFVLALTHDLRTPLAAAKMSAEMLRDSVADKKLHCLLMTNLNRIERMVQDLLDAKLIQAERVLPIETANCDLFDIAAEVRDRMVVVHKRDIVVTGGHAVGHWDQAYLTRAVENLVANAIKYGDHKPIIITVRAAREGAELSVFNEGKPIPADSQATLFDQFSRLREKSAVKDGWGIGLTLVRGAVESHGGTIEVESPINGGTEFRFWIPRNPPVKE